MQTNIPGHPQRFIYMHGPPAGIATAKNLVRELVEGGDEGGGGVEEGGAAGGVEEYGFGGVGNELEGSVEGDSLAQVAFDRRKRLLTHMTCIISIWS